MDRPLRRDYDDEGGYGDRGYARDLRRGSRGGGYRRGGGGRGRGRNRNFSGNKRNREEFETPEDNERKRLERIQQLIVRIHEKSSLSLHSTLTKLSEALLYDLSQYRDFIISVLFDCVNHLGMLACFFLTFFFLCVFEIYKKMRFCEKFHTSKTHQDSPKKQSYFFLSQCYFCHFV